MADNQYTEDNIRSLDWKEHIRLRPGMYIGKLGDGSSADDGIYILLKEVLDNSIDEFVMGEGKVIDIIINEVNEWRIFSHELIHTLEKINDQINANQTGYGK